MAMAVKFYKNGNIDVTIEKTKSLKVAINAIINTASLFASSNGRTLSLGMEYHDRNGNYYEIDTTMVKKAMETGKIKLVRTKLEKTEVKYSMQDLYEWAEKNMSKIEFWQVNDYLDSMEGVIEDFRDYKMSRGEVCDLCKLWGIKSPWSVDDVVEKKCHDKKLTTVPKDEKCHASVTPVLNQLNTIRLKNCKITVCHDSIVCKLNHGRGTKSFKVGFGKTRKLLQAHASNLLVNWADVKSLLKLN